MNIRLCGDAILFASGWNDGQRSWMNISSSLRAVDVTGDVWNLAGSEGGLSIGVIYEHV